MARTSAHAPGASGYARPMRNMSTTTIVYAVVGALMFGFFVWLLTNMASTSDRAGFILGTLGISFVIVLVAAGAGGLLGKRDSD